MKTDLTWQEVYKLPLRLDDWFGYVWTNTNGMALQFHRDVKEEDQVKIVKAINGINKYKIPLLKNNSCDFYENDEYIFCVRGWGNLTGVGALNLTEKEAIKIQDKFIDYIKTKLIL